MSDEEETKEFYEMDLICTNCEETDTYEIECGTLVSEYLKDADCSTCSCKQLIKIEEDDD